MDNYKRELARRRFLVGAAIVCVAAPVMFAQRPMKDTMAMRGTAMSMLPVPLSVPMERMGSGTTWIPDAVSLPSRHFAAAGWDFMLHGFAFGQYDYQSGPRVVDVPSRQAMEDILSAIQDGSFASRWIAEADAGLPEFLRLRREAQTSQLETMGRQLRQMMPWLESEQKVPPS